MISSSRVNSSQISGFHSPVSGWYPVWTEAHPGIDTASIKLPEAPVLTFRKSRRFMVMSGVLPGGLVVSNLTGNRLNSGHNARIGTVLAQVSGHGGHNVLTRWRRIVVQQVRCGHDLARLAVTTLGNALINPGLLQRVQLAIFGQPFDGGHDSAIDRRHRC